MIARDGFAGVGWGVALKNLGIGEFAIEIEPTVIAARAANGMETQARDMWNPGTIIEQYDLAIDSPPCQTFSLAGRGHGRAALDDVMAAIADHRYHSIESLKTLGREVGDDRTALVLTPLFYAARDRPRTIILEQVPSVLPVWQAMAEVLETWGYSTWAGVLNAEQYGVPQTRRRAILIARMDGEAKPPTPTHSRYYSRDRERLDPGVLRWVSMADALGWGLTDEPMPTITAGTHGPPDRWASGGRSVRERINSKQGGPYWKPRGAVLSTGTRDNAARRRIDEPAPALAFGHDAASYRWVDALTGDVYDAVKSSDERLGVVEAAAIQSFPTGFVWPGSKTASFKIIGNAVPPLLAERIITAALA